MSRASNTIVPSDMSLTPIRVRYTSSYTNLNMNNYGIVAYSGVNGSVGTTGSVPQQTINYHSAKQLYYSNYATGSFLTTSSSFDNFLQSTAASGTFDADVRYFPTESNAQIGVLSIPRGVFGENIARNGFILSSSLYRIQDDGNGNLIDSYADYQLYISGGYYASPEDYYQSYNSSYVTNTKVGNILYSQGMVVITNKNYQQIFNFNSGNLITSELGYFLIDEFNNYLTTE